LEKSLGYAVLLPVTDGIGRWSLKVEVNGKPVVDSEKFLSLGMT
jgi:hypothetical protein